MPTRGLRNRVDARKLIAVVYADMVGYNRLLGLDDPGTLKRLRNLRQALIGPSVTEYGSMIAPAMKSRSMTSRGLRLDG
jgi:class 3 adenylate cyclase